MLYHAWMRYYASVVPYSFNFALCRIDDSIDILDAPSNDNNLQLLVSPSEGIDGYFVEVSLKLLLGVHEAIYSVSLPFLYCFFTFLLCP